MVFIPFYYRTIIAITIDFPLLSASYLSQIVNNRTDIMTFRP